VTTTTESTPEVSLRLVAENWREALSERERKEIAFAELYAAQFNHGTTGHNALLLIARLAERLDIAAGLKEPPLLPEPGDDLVLTFGKYRDQRLSVVLTVDRGYVEWLAREGRDADVKAAAAALLRGPVMPLPFDDAPPPTEAPAEEGELPF
jgi:hypothetical protein